MLRLLFALVVALAFISISVQAEEIIRSYKLPSNCSALQQIADRFEIVKKLEDGYEVYVASEYEKDFLTLAPEAKLLEKDINAYLKSLKASKSPILEAYRKFPEIEVELQDLVKKYPKLVGLETYGKTSKGRNLYALRLGSNLSKPQLMISAATHGDELITVEVLLNLVHELLEGYSSDQRLSKMLDEHVIYILPVASPDGFANETRYVEGKDPNRVFPWPGNPSNAPLGFIGSWMKFAGDHKIVGSIDLHAYGKLIMYPWGYTTTAPEVQDEKEMSDLVTKMARENRYTAGQISTTIYVAKGNSADYFYWKNKTRAIAVEFTDEKIPDLGRIPFIVKEAREMVWQFIEHF